MKLGVFEWLTGGGCWLDQTLLATDDPYSSSLLVQGRQMRDALAIDLAQAGYEILVLHDDRLTSSLEIENRVQQLTVSKESNLKMVLLDWAHDCDGVFLIAPETGGRLLRVRQWLQEASMNVMSPDADFIRLTSDKYSTSLRLARHGVPVPKCCRSKNPAKLLNDRRIRLPLVAKPVDGAGSDGVRLISDAHDLTDLAKENDLMFEEFVPGISVSVSVLHFGHSFELLPPTKQQFDSSPFGAYIGAEYPLEAKLADRASALATKVVQALPPTRGYFGIDLVLGDHVDSIDYVIEVNPRLTMSYLKLREVCDFNIANRLIKKLMQNFLSVHD